MKLSLEISLENSAFENANGAEASRILNELSQQIQCCLEPGDGGRLMDHNGNTAGGWSVVTDYEYRCRELELEGLTRSDAQGIADMEGVPDE